MIELTTELLAVTLQTLLDIDINAYVGLPTAEDGFPTYSALDILLLVPLLLLLCNTSVACCSDVTAVPDICS